MAHYFLTDGEPDPSKTPWPLALRGLQDSAALVAKTEQIPGLETCIGGTGAGQTLCIGWSRPAVSRLARQFDAESRQTEPTGKDGDIEEANAEAGADQVPEEHRVYLQQLANEGLRVDEMSMTPIFLQKAMGSYIMRSRYIE